jgi:hypothetical protein
MNTEFKPKLITLRSSGEKISDQDPAVTADEVDEIVNSSQKNLQGLQSALQLRKLRYVIYTLYAVHYYSTTFGRASAVSPPKIISHELSLVFHL